jgi:hypothetical protein
MYMAWCINRRAWLGNVDVGVVVFGVPFGIRCYAQQEVMAE